MKQAIGIPHNTEAVIFAGGKSSRMGSDKALLPFGGQKSMSAFLYRKLSKLFDELYLSSKTDKFDFEASLILDAYPQSSPLVGIVSTFEYLKQHDEIFVLSVDAPFVDEEIITRLYQTPRHYDATIAQSPSGTQPLCGIYRQSILPKAYEFLHQDNHKLNLLLSCVHTNFVHFDDDAKFSNLNYPSDYQKALYAHP